MKLRAKVTPEQFAFLDEPLIVTNRRSISIRSGYITFYVTPDFVVAIKKTQETTRWEDQGKWETLVYEIKTPVEVI